jgi:hypothetical protein
MAFLAGRGHAVEAWIVVLLVIELDVVLGDPDQPIGRVEIVLALAQCGLVHRVAGDLLDGMRDQVAGQLLDLVLVKALLN